MNRRSLVALAGLALACGGGVAEVEPPVPVEEAPSSVPGDALLQDERSRLAQIVGVPVEGGTNGDWTFAAADGPHRLVVLLTEEHAGEEIVVVAERPDTEDFTGHGQGMFVRVAGFAGGKMTFQAAVGEYGSYGGPPGTPRLVDYGSGKWAVVIGSGWSGQGWTIETEVAVDPKSEHPEAELFRIEKDANNAGTGEPEKEWHTEWSFSPTEAHGAYRLVGKTTRIFGGESTETAWESEFDGTKYPIPEFVNSN